MTFPNLNWSVNNRYLGTNSPIGLGNSIGGYAQYDWSKTSNNNMANAWYKFKQFMTINVGWTVTKSGVGWSDTDQLNYNGDIFYDEKLFNFSLIYFVLQDPGSKRELLFYRSPGDVGDKRILINDPFNGNTKSFFSDLHKDFSQTVSNPTLIPILQIYRASTDAYTGATCLDNGDGTITISNIYVPGTPNIYLSENMVNRYISLFPPTDSIADPSTLFLPTAQIIEIVSHNSLKINGTLSNPLLVGNGLSSIDTPDPITHIMSMTANDAIQSNSPIDSATTITISDAATPGNNGTFPITSINKAYHMISYTNANGSATEANSATLSWSLSNGTSLVGNGLGFCITDTEAMTGNTAFVDDSARISSISGLVNMTSKSIGHTLKIKTYNATGVNDGEYLIIDIVNDTSVKVINKDGNVFDNTDVNNGKLLWKECFQLNDFVSVDQDRMSIAYSAKSKFTTFQNFEDTDYAWKVPFADDMVWISPAEQALPAATITNPVSYPARGQGNYFADSQNNKIRPNTNWNLHMCAAAATPYPFYIWITYKEQDVVSYATAQKQAAINPGSGTNSNIPIDGSITQTYDSLSFLAMDALDDVASGDVDEVVFWCDVSNGAPSHKTGRYPATMSNFNELLPTTGIGSNPLYTIRSWYKKPNSFADRNDFINQFEHMQCGFLPTSVLMYQVVQSYENGPSRQIVTLIPGNLNSNIYTSNDEIYPLMYSRGSIQYTYQNQYHPVYNANIKEPFKLPVSYKGVSRFMKIAGMTRSSGDLLNEGAELKKYVYCGRFAVLCIPWNGIDIPNQQ